MLTRSFLVEMRQRALRRGILFKTLDRLERGILNLTIRLVDRIESAVLGVELVKILLKLERALTSGFIRRVREFGEARARKLSDQAAAWGNSAAEAWSTDHAFIRYVTLLDVNAPSGWGVPDGRGGS